MGDFITLCGKSLSNNKPSANYLREFVNSFFPKNSCDGFSNLFVHDCCRVIVTLMFSLITNLLIGLIISQEPLVTEHVAIALPSS